MRRSNTWKHVGLCLSMLAMALFGAVGCDGGGGGDECATDSCSGHGACDDATGEIVCTCDAGYAGEACDACATGYHDDGEGTCVPDAVTCQADSCHSHGACDDTTGAIVCTCDAGYSGATCDTCAAGYHDDGAGACVPDTTCGANSCSGHGTCDDTTGSIVCTCDAGYTGAACADCDVGYHDDGAGGCVPDGETCQADSCNLHGLCDDSTGVIVCSCDAGYTGAACDACAAGYHDDGAGACVPDTTCGANTCSGHGTCDDSTGSIVCTCDAGWAGAFCDTCAAGYHDDGAGACVPDTTCGANTCSGHGTCDDSTGAIVCTCVDGHAGDRCEGCADGFQDNNGDGSCLPSCDVVDCVLTAHCVDSSGQALCVCDDGYTGEECDQCAEGYQDNDQDGSCLPDCSLVDMNCGPNAECDDSGGTTTCVCVAGYHDDGTGACVPDQVVTCQADSCSFHGGCDDSTGVLVCTCDPGYAQPSCATCAAGYHDDGTGACVPDQVVTCQADSCSFHGGCDDSTGVIVCTCDPGYAQPICATCAATHQDNDGDGICLPTCATLGWTCSGHGQCDDSGGAAECLCDQDYQPDGLGNCIGLGNGEDCSAPLQLDLSQASVSGTLVGTANDLGPSLCATYSEGSEVVYTFTVVEAIHVTFETDGLFDSVLYLRSDCANGPDLFCNDDDGPNAGSRIEGDLAPGTYYLIVDAYYADGGDAYTLSITVECGPGWVYDPVSGDCVDDPCLDPNPCQGAHQQVCVVALPGYTCECDPGYIPDGAGGCMLDPNPQGESCADAMLLPLSANGSVSSSTLGGQDDAQNETGTGCYGTAGGPDRVYILDLPVEMRFEAQTDGLYDSMMYLRSVCDSQPSQIACDDDSGPDMGSMLLQILPAGTYFLWVDTYGTGTGGDYTLTYSMRANPCADEELACPGTPVCQAAADFSSYECVCPAGTIPWNGDCLDDPCEPNPCTQIEHKNRCVVDDPSIPASHCECNVGYIPDPGDPSLCIMDPNANEWAFIVFLNADNNLESFGFEDVAEMGVAGSTAYVHIAALFDTYAGPAQIIYVTPGAYDVVSDEGELDMGDWQVLRDFGIWAVQNYPARHYALTMWNHGAGWEKAAPAKNPVLKGFSNDDHGSSAGISVANGDYAQALAGITAALGAKLDIVGFDACLMGMWEVAHESAPYADYLIASSETEPGAGWAYDQFLPGLIADYQMPAVDLAISVVDAYYNAGSGNSTLAVTDLNTLADLEAAISAFADTMMAHPENKAAIKTIAGATQSFYYSDNKDLQDFAERLIAGASIHQDIKAAAQALVAQLGETVVYNRNQADYPGANGLAAYLPTSSPDSAYASAMWAAGSRWDDFLTWLNQ